MKRIITMEIEATDSEMAEEIRVADAWILAGSPWAVKVYDEIVEDEEDEQGDSPRGA